MKKFIEYVNRRKYIVILLFMMCIAIVFALWHLYHASPFFYKEFTLSIVSVGTIAVFIDIYDTFYRERKKIIYSDEQRLLSFKRTFLDSILNTLKLDIDNDLKECLENGEIDDANSLIEDKINALNKLVETVTGNSTKSLRGTDISSVSAFYESTNTRIRTEIFRINQNAKINLFIGVFFSAVSIGILIWSVYFKGIEAHQLLDMIPRVAISLLIQAFAFFFFSQYRKQQEDIKYWNNEKTNLDIKIFALSIAIDDEEIGTKDYMRNLITDLIKTERNIFGTTTQPKEDKPKEGQDDKKLYEDVFSKIKDLAELLPKK